MEFAIIETGGKQYKVAKGDTITIEKLSAAPKAGDSVVFDKVLLVQGTDTKIGMPYVSGAKVTASFVGDFRAQKVTTIHSKAKSNRFKKYGHRQPQAKVKIEKIS